jgi:hypothetical protein
MTAFLAARLSPLALQALPPLYLYSWCSTLQHVASKGPLTDSMRLGLITLLCCMARWQQVGQQVAAQHVPFSLLVGAWAMALAKEDDVWGHVSGCLDGILDGRSAQAALRHGLLEVAVAAQEWQAEDDQRLQQRAAARPASPTSPGSIRIRRSPADGSDGSVAEGLMAEMHSPVYVPAPSLGSRAGAGAGAAEAEAAAGAGDSGGVPAAPAAGTGAEDTSASRGREQEEGPVVSEVGTNQDAEQVGSRWRAVKPA